MSWVSTTSSIQWAALSIMVGVIREPKFKHVFYLSENTLKHFKYTPSTGHSSLPTIVYNQHNQTLLIITLHQDTLSLAGNH